MNSKIITGIVVIGVLVVVGFLLKSIFQESPTIPNPEVPLTEEKLTSTPEETMKKLPTATIKTNLGTIVFELYPADASKTVENFIALAEKGFYNNLTFHRVIKNFMIQGGDPNGNGTGGPGYSFEDELNPNTESYKRGYVRGAVAMANAGPDTNGSQFFIMHADYPLPHNYTIFGYVTEGQSVVDKIASVPTDRSDRPLTPVLMESVTIK